MGLEQLRAGDIMVGPIGGAAGAFVGAAQLALATVEPGWVWRTGVKEWFRKRHCGVVTEASQTLPPGSAQNLRTKQWHSGPLLPEAMPFGDEFQAYPTGVITAPKLVQAMPGGAEEIELTAERHWTPEYVYIRPMYDFVQDQEYRVPEAARSFVGTPYDFKTYGVIPPYRAGLRPEWIKDIIAGTDTMMCSRLVDASLAAAGYHLFDDGRLPGNVTPSELYRRLRQLPHELILPVRI